MLPSRLDRLLAEERCLLADGGMGSLLYDRGLAMGVSPELWLRQHPESVAGVHHAYVAAGADILLTNSFGANARRLKVCGLADQTHDLNVIAARLACAAAESETSRPVVVAGAVGPIWESIADDDAVGVFEQQMQALKAGGVDLIWIETMSGLGEMRAAARAAARTGLPFVITASFDRKGRTLAGYSAHDIALALMKLDPPLLAIGANCGDGPDSTLDALAAMRAAVPRAMLIGKANAGLPQIDGGKANYTVTDDIMRNYARACRDIGVRIIGGCCGTAPAHIAAMRGALDIGTS